MAAGRTDAAAGVTAAKTTPDPLAVLPLADDSRCGTGPANLPTGVMDRLRQHVMGLGLIVLSCGGRANSDGSDGTSGAETGGHATAAGAPNAAGGTSAGGTASGGNAAGGTSTGGTPSGGTPSGGTASGGTNTGGLATGGREHTGGTPSSGTSSGGTNTGGVATGGATAAGAAGTHTGGTSGSGGTSLACQVGIRIDDCCSAPIAVEPKAFADPCVLPYASYYPSEAYEACPAAKKCLMVNCTHPDPPSRVAMLRNGQCVFENECIPAAAPYNFCTVATDYHRCCSCPEVFPSALVKADPCLVTEGLPEPGTCADCGTVTCAACQTPKPSVYCDYNTVTKLSVCRGRVE